MVGVRITKEELTRRRAGEVHRGVLLRGVVVRCDVAFNSERNRGWTDAPFVHGYQPRDDLFV